MKEYILTWGWQPPLYEIKNDRIVRLFIYSDSYEETVKHINTETGEETEETVTRWKCKVYEKESRGLVSRLRKNNLSAVKEVALECLSLYDLSDRVNSFTVSGYQMWLDKETRSGLMLRFESEKAMGLTETTLWSDGIAFPMSLDVANKLLLDIEMYASACYDVTQQHIANIKALESVEDVKAYDFTAGYPEKLVI